MSPAPPLLLKSNLKQLRLPTSHAEFEKLAREAARADQTYDEYLLGLTELEVTARQANALKARIQQASFPLEKDFDTFDFSVAGVPPKQKLLELARGEWIEQKFREWGLSLEEIECLKQMPENGDPFPPAGDCGRAVPQD